MEKNCKNCGTGFSVTDFDLKLLGKLSPVFDGGKRELPSPSFCPNCRQMRRISYRNERKFYKRKCDATGKEIISVYSPSFPGKVYEHDFWWSDDWDPLKFGRDFDFGRSRGFFEQFLALSLDTPRLPLVCMNSENSLYTNHSAYNKNCYMCINTGWGEDLLYSSNYNLYDKDCVDCLAIFKCERCYFCVDTKNSHFCKYLHECDGCVECEFGYDLKGCENCFCCYNLRHKKFCIFNKQYSKEDYEQEVAKLRPKTWKEYFEFFNNFVVKLSGEAIYKNLRLPKCQNCTGDHLANCKNVFDSFYAFGSEDCAYIYDTGEVKDCMDTVEPFKGELQYETHGCNMGYSVIFCSKCYENRNLAYCQYCWNCADCFGCFGLRNKKYCVFNKQYSKDEYGKLTARIVEKMAEVGEWGEFFPMEDSPFAYEETTAQEYYPREGLPTEKFPKSENVAKTEGAVICEISGRPFRLVDAELKFYKENNLPIPSVHPDERHMMRMVLRNPRKIRKSTCSKCGSEIPTTCRENIKKIYCEKCYLGEVY